MIVAPSIASGDPLRLADEIALCDECFDAVHLDVADGVAVRGISFGLGACIAACELSRSASKSIHLEVADPLAYVDDIRRCSADVLFVQTDNRRDPLGTLRAMRDAGLGMAVGANVSNLDAGRSYFDELIALGGPVLVGTTAHDDVAQACRRDMLDLAASIADGGRREVWVDGGIGADRLAWLAERGIYAAVLGRAVFEDRARARALARRWGFGG